MAKTVICPICGAKFETRRPNKKYCSFSCKEASVKLRRMRWDNQNPNYYREYMKQYRADKGGRRATGNAGQEPPAKTG